MKLSFAFIAVSLIFLPLVGFAFGIRYQSWTSVPSAPSVSPITDALYLTQESNGQQIVHYRSVAGDIKITINRDNRDTTLVSDFGFFGNPAKFIFLQFGSDNNSVVLYNLQGQELKYLDDKNLLTGWVVGSIDEYGWSSEYRAIVANFNLWKDNGNKKARVKVNLDELRVISESFININ